MFHEAKNNNQIVLEKRKRKESSKRTKLAFLTLLEIVNFPSIIKFGENKAICLFHEVKNAFLNGDMEEEIYMEVPLEFGSDVTNKKVCKLKKALYELKQSLRVWFGMFAKVTKNMGYGQN